MAKKTDAKTASKPASKKPTKPPVAAKPAAPAKATPGKSGTAAADAKSKASGKKPTAAKSNGKQPAAKTTAKPARVPAASPTANSKQAAGRPAEVVSEAFYFLSEAIDPQVTRSRPAAQQIAVGRFADFADARQHAIDYLVDLIDRCEIRLWQFKRADSLELFEQLVREHDHPPIPAANAEAPPTPS